MTPAHPWLAQLPALQQALRTDVLISLPTAHRLVGIPSAPTPADLILLASCTLGLYVHRYVGLTAQRYGQQVSVPYLSLSRTPEIREKHIVRSLLALAEARYMLRCPANPTPGVEPETPVLWQVQAHQKPSGAGSAGASIADAVYQCEVSTPAGRRLLIIPVEDDSGEYERGRVEEHMMTYARVGPQIWVAGTWQRQRELFTIWQALYPERMNFYPLLSCWWDA
ncbi:hypothetical protein ACFSC4_29815 [Deinococcus malanensis]|nr:hypothetical protein [Deinococcus malanensis]